jgi:pSer/pThr/pTyr-binding forkhead associated (FHA) protein
MKTTIKIGRDNSNDIMINEPRVSRSHAVITDMGDGTFEIKDLGSTNGTFVNGIPITSQIIQEGDKVEVAESIVNWYSFFVNHSNGEQKSVIQENAFSKILKTITVGSSSNNEIVMSDNFVSKYHAKISLLKNDNYYIQDLGSTNGTFVNGVKIISKNFLKTDRIKIASVDLPENWFQNENLKINFFKDHKKPLFIFLTVFVILCCSVIFYLNRCQWFNLDCILSEKEMYNMNKNSVVSIKHDYFFTIKVDNVKYYVGRNKDFDIVEANTSKEYLLPYGSVNGYGCFVSDDGKILTSALIANPWLNYNEQKIMIQQVEKSRTIKKLNEKSYFSICGETAELIWLPSSSINNKQNYIAATSKTECKLTDTSSVIIQSVKKSVPQNASVVNFFYNYKNPANFIHKTPGTYYTYIFPFLPNEMMRDTFLLVEDSFSFKTYHRAPLNGSISVLPEEGSPVFNERGELIAVIQQNEVIMISQFIKQLY